LNICDVITVCKPSNIGDAQRPARRHDLLQDDVVLTGQFVPASIAPEQRAVEAVEGLSRAEQTLFELRYRKFLWAGG
jgi:hypothetical protein